jgi:hypothetical protein
MFSQRCVILLIATELKANPLFPRERNRLRGLRQIVGEANTIH